MKLIRYEKPEFGSTLNRLENWFRDSDRFFGFRNWPSLFDGDWESGLASGTNRLRADLYEDDDAYYARFELPGLKKDDVKIELHNAVLTVSYEKHVKSDEGESSESFSRSVTVPEGTEFDNISAKHEDGLLTISMPKGKASKSRQIKIH